MLENYLIQLVDALGVADHEKRKEIASDMEKVATIADGEEMEILRNKLRSAITPYGRFEIASGRSDDLMKALEVAISAMLLKEERFFRSYAIVVVVCARDIISQKQVNEINQTMRRLAGRYTNIVTKPTDNPELEEYDVRLLAIGLHEKGSVK